MDNDLLVSAFREWKSFSNNRKKKRKKAIYGAYSVELKRKRLYFNEIRRVIERNRYLRIVVLRCSAKHKILLKELVLKGAKRIIETRAKRDRFIHKLLIINYEFILRKYFERFETYVLKRKTLKMKITLFRQQSSAKRRVSCFLALKFAKSQRLSNEKRKLELRDLALGFRAKSFVKKFSKAVKTAKRRAEKINAAIHHYETKQATKLQARTKRIFENWKHLNEGQKQLKWNLRTFTLKKTEKLTKSHYLAFSAWKKFVCFKQNNESHLQAFVSKRETSLLKCVIEKWKFWSVTRRASREKELFQPLKIKIKTRIFEKLQKYSERMRLARLIESKRIQSMKIKVLDLWREKLERKKGRRLKEKAILKHMVNKLKRKYFESWIKRQSIAIASNKKECAALIHYEAFLKSKSLKSIFSYCSLKIEKKKTYSGLKAILCRRFFTKMKLRFRLNSRTYENERNSRRSNFLRILKKAWRKKLRSINDYFTFSLKKKVILGLKIVKGKRNLKAEQKLNIQAHYICRQLSISLAKWVRFTRKKNHKDRKKLIALTQWFRYKLRLSLKMWGFYVEKKRAKQEEELAVFELFKKNNLRNILSRMLEKGFEKEKQREQTSLENAIKESKKRVYLLEKYGKKWMDFYLRKKRLRPIFNLQNYQLPRPLVRQRTEAQKTPIKGNPRTEDFLASIKSKEAERTYKIKEENIVNWFTKDFKAREVLAPKKQGGKRESPARKHLEDLIEEYNPKLTIKEKDSGNMKELELKTKECDSKISLYKNMNERINKGEIELKIDLISLKLEIKKLLREISVLK